MIGLSGERDGGARPGTAVDGGSGVTIRGDCRWRRPLAFVLAAGFPLMSACGGTGAADSPASTAVSTSSVVRSDATAEGTDSPSSSSATVRVTSSPAPPTSVPHGTPAPVTVDAFAREFAPVRAKLSGPAGVAVVPVGGGRELVAGDLKAGVAWSTSKVPVAIAAIRAGQAGAGDVRTAIRDSDNASAERLWQSLGGGSRAAAATEAVLRDGGDGSTDVPSERRRAGFTVFGQTVWGSGPSARFAASLQCMRDAGDVLGHMRAVSGNQQWGFWRVKGSAVKGGWGPVGSGYLVRQIAVVPVDGGGYAGVSAIVLAPSFEAGKRDLDTISAWAESHLEGMGGTC